MGAVYPLLNSRMGSLSHFTHCCGKLLFNGIENVEDAIGIFVSVKLCDEEIGEATLPQQLHSRIRSPDLHRNDWSCPWVGSWMPFAEIKRGPYVCFTTLMCEQQKQSICFIRMYSAISALVETPKEWFVWLIQYAQMFFAGSQLQHGLQAVAWS